jgi:hypothetical protein
MGVSIVSLAGGLCWIGAILRALDKLPILSVGDWLIAGLICMAAAWLMHRMEQRVLEAEIHLDFSQRLDEVALGVSQLRASMQELRIERARMEGAINALPQDLAQAQENATREAVFRLAASLDQLHVRLDARIEELEERLRPREPEPSAVLPAARTSPRECSAEETRDPVSLGLLDSFDDA